MKEEWRAVQGYSGLYEVSDLGRIRSLPREIKTYNGGKWTRPGKIIKPITNKDGYQQVHICKDGKQTTRKVHQLVALAFLENPDGFLEVNHKNENKADNRAANLEWCSREYNINYGTARKRTGIANGRPVIQYSLNGEKIQEFYSSYEAQRRLGVIEQSINLCCLGRRQQAGGFRWKYVDDKTPFSKYVPKKRCVAQKKDGKLVATFRSITDAFRATGINNISACCRGKIPHAGGYVWKYLKEIKELV